MCPVYQPCDVVYVFTYVYSSTHCFSLPLFPLLLLVVHEHQRRHILAAHRIVHGLVEDTPQSFAAVEEDKTTDTNQVTRETPKNEEDGTLSSIEQETVPPKEEQEDSTNSDGQQA